MDKNRKLFLQAKKVMPGGVNSPVRAFRAVGGAPIFIKRAKGSKVYGENDNEYIDYCMSWGALILGHAHAQVVKAIQGQAGQGTSFGASTEKEIALAQLIKRAIPSIEKLRLVNSGTEAVMAAIRLARAFTKRDFIIKFDGCYHGHADSLLVNAGSGLSTFAISSSKGVPKDFIKYTISLPYNNISAVNKICKKKGNKIACIIVEPVACNMGLVLPQDGFLEALRAITKRYNIVLIFDEVITGFRLTFGGAQDLFKIKPDITTLGKIIGGGLPVGAVGGEKEIMDLLAPVGDVYQAGTLSGNPIATSAGIKTLSILKNNKAIYKELEDKINFLAEQITYYLHRKKIAARVNRFGSMFTVFFTKDDVIDYASCKKSGVKRFAVYFQKMLNRGIYLPASQFETSFISQAHTQKDIDRTVISMAKSIG